MALEDMFKKLLNENPKTVSDEAIRLLVKVAENILEHPSNLKLRTLQKNNTTISKKILPAKGAVECLKLMGFQENNTTFTMQMDIPLNHLQEFKNTIQKYKDAHDSLLTSKVEVKGPTTTTKINNNQCELPIKRIVLPPLVLIYSNPFLRRVETYFHNVLQYENKDLQQRAVKLLPLMTLEQNAQRRLRAIQEHIKKNKLEDPEISLQDALILELLKWFKEDFFYWVDSPKCSNCNGETTFSHMSTDPDLLVFTDRVELHRCSTCHQFTPFPRYNDINILLETREGRCGEWANTFTLFCRAMGWDSRFIVDEGDHVWTEVYSVTQKRWMHCDPCENVCDTPLLYENGWQKKISYVMAYSADEVQDVTWRYSSNHKDVLKRRKNCSETELIDALFKLKSTRQTNFSDARKKYLTKRLLNELVEFLTEKKPTDSDQKGRSSGSAAWRLARGETHEEVGDSLFIWQINGDDIVDNKIIIRYSASLDKYEYISGGKNIMKLEKWNTGAFKHSGIFRKEEQDWKMVYLTRIKGQDTGEISWKIEIKNSSKFIDTVLLSFDFTTYENGIVNVEISSDNKSKVLNDGSEILLKDFSGSTSLTVSASLSGGKGDAAWQHAQLFRQSSDSCDFPFSLIITFK